ncbi:hypothetical protein PUN28_008108 [Cardiocondyla obscurior]|uniref:Uncharacterized protein n=1 Tax=Cardiocondyla obscurior TaxID=286306 RepID=A0AAW2FW55_9HYME
MPRGWRARMCSTSIVDQVKNFNSCGLPCKPLSVRRTEENEKINRC